MDRRPAPREGLARSFQIGIRPLDPADWIDVDAQLLRYLAEKQRVARDHAAQVFAAEPGTEAAQAELLSLLVGHLCDRFAQVYRREGQSIAVLPAGHAVRLDGPEPALRVAGSLVQEDLVLMRRGAAGWRIAAASLSFPSSWSLPEKFGRPMHEVHAPVPGFAAGTRNAQLIERMFDNLRPEMPVLRWNWSLFGDDHLFHPEPSHPHRRFGVAAERVFLRVERQTLRKLPVSGDIVFTIRIYVDPLAALARHAEGRAIAADLAAQIAALTEEQAAYKGLLEDRQHLQDRLAAIAAS